MEAKKPIISDFFDILRQSFLQKVSCPKCNDIITVIEFEGEEEIFERYRWYENCTECGQAIDWGAEYGVTDLAIEALEKQISKKVLKAKGKIITNQYKCPNCKRQWSGAKWDYCHECGQKLYWEGDNYDR